MGDRVGSIPVIRTRFKDTGSLEITRFPVFFIVLKFADFLRTVENKLF